MAETQETRIGWKVAPDHKTVHPNGFVMTNADFGTGPCVLVRFVTNWVDIEGESFVATVDKQAGSITQSGESHYQQANIRIEQAAVILPPSIAGEMAATLLGRFDIFPPDQQAAIRKAIAGLASE